MSVKLRSVLITGANRGIGLQLVKSLTQTLKPEILFATFRDASKSQELQDLASQNKTIRLLQIDVRDHEKLAGTAEAVAKEVGDGGLNLLVNNAGISSKVAKLSAVRQQELLDNLEINAVAPILMTKAMLPLLEKASASNPNAQPGIGRAAVVNVSSILGSIGLNDLGGMYAYRCSKAAINAATKSMHLDFRKAKIIAIALHPGWVRTDMGGTKAPLSTEQSAAGIISLLESLSTQHSGKFLQYDGKELQW
ncbi:unnamed protein product [Orchesella dallaii]|uniref:C-factor n=1 Tax=Orchesella dallaii TaxID=48710 RepID=A0ABP1PPL4_9HEXA